MLKGSMLSTFRTPDPHVGFVSTRLAGTDGVSWEADKWASVREGEGFKCFYFTGELDRPEDRSYLAEEAHFTHPDIEEINRPHFVLTDNPNSLTLLTRKIGCLSVKQIGILGCPLSPLLT